MDKEHLNLRKKGPVFLFLVTLIVSILIPASAGWWYVKTPDGKTVNLRDYDSGEVIAQIPYGTRLYANEDSTELSAYVTYKGLGGFVKWKYLVRDKPEPYQGKPHTASKPKVTEAPGTFGEGPYAVSISGGVLQFPNKKGKASGTKYFEIRYEEPTTVVVTATVPKGKKIDCWMINGIKMLPSGKSLTLIAEGQDISVEILFR